MSLYLPCFCSLLDNGCASYHHHRSGSGSGSRRAANPPTTTSSPPPERSLFTETHEEPQTLESLPAPTSSPPSRKRKAPGSSLTAGSPPTSTTAYGDPGGLGEPTPTMAESSTSAPPAKKSRTNTPWTPAEEQRLKTMRDAGNSWSEIAKVRSSPSCKLK